MIRRRGRGSVLSTQTAFRALSLKASLFSRADTARPFPALAQHSRRTLRPVASPAPSHPIWQDTRPPTAPRSTRLPKRRQRACRGFGRKINQTTPPTPPPRLEPFSGFSSPSRRANGRTASPAPLLTHSREPIVAAAPAPLRAAASRRPSRMRALPRRARAVRAQEPHLIGGKIRTVAVAAILRSCHSARRARRRIPGEQRGAAPQRLLPRCEGAAGGTHRPAKERRAPRPEHPASRARCPPPLGAAEGAESQVRRGR